MKTAKGEVDSVLQDLAAGKLSSPAAEPQSGWEMSLPTGKTVVRSVLQAEAAPLIAIGPGAIPHLFTWVMNDNLALRYVAIYSLEQITGEKPFVGYFDQNDVDGNREKAIQVWRKWREDNAAQ